MEHLISTWGVLEKRIAEDVKRGQGERMCLPPIRGWGAMSLEVGSSRLGILSSLGLTKLGEKCSFCIAGTSGDSLRALDLTSRLGFSLFDLERVGNE